MLLPILFGFFLRCFFRGGSHSPQLSPRTRPDRPNTFHTFCVCIHSRRSVVVGLVRVKSQKAVLERVIMCSIYCYYIIIV